MKDFDPYLLTKEDRRILVRHFVITVNARGPETDYWKYDEVEKNVLVALLTVVGFDVVNVANGKVKGGQGHLIVTTRHFGQVEVGEMATRWINDLMKFTSKEIRISTMANVERLVDEVLAKVELTTPLKPIPLVVGASDVLLELPVVQDPELHLEYPWFIKHTRPDDDLPKFGKIGIHGPTCGGVIRRTVRGAKKGRHNIVCATCGYTVSIPGQGLTYMELRDEINPPPTLAGKTEKQPVVKVKKFNQKMARTGPRPWMRNNKNWMRKKKLTA